MVVRFVTVELLEATRAGIQQRPGLWNKRWKAVFTRAFVLTFQGITPPRRICTVPDDSKKKRRKGEKWSKTKRKASRRKMKSQP